MQETAGELELALIRVLGIPEHGESKVSHLGAIAKSIKSTLQLFKSMMYLAKKVFLLM